MNQKTWLIGGIAAVLAVVLCACGIVGYTLWLQPSPASVAEKYLEAYQDRDSAAVSKLVCATRRGTLGDLADGLQLKSWEILSSDETGDRATVRAKLQLRDRQDTITISLVKEDGDWRVCNIR